MKRFTTLVALMLMPAAVLAKDSPPECRPCGDWQLDAAASEAAEPAVDAALARYKPPKPRRFRPRYGDVASETEAEFQASLDERFGPADRRELREELLKQLASPERFSLRQDGEDIVVLPEGGYRRRVTPGEPHARVDSLGTAEIEATLRGPTLTIAETYKRRTQNREVYAVDSAGAVLKVTRSVRRPGLPEVVVHATYRMH